MIPSPRVTQFETLDRRARDRASVKASTRRMRALRLLRRSPRARPLRAPQCA